MTNVETRTSKAGRTTYAVKWREGGGRAGAPGTRTLDDLDQAKTLAGLIKANGHRFPTAAQLVAFGLGVLVDESPATGEAPVTVTELVSLYLDQLGRKLNGPQPQTLAKYRGDLRRYIAPTRLGKMVAFDVDWEDVEDWQHDLHTSITGDRGRRPLHVNTIAIVRSGVLAPAFKWATSTRGRHLLDANPMLDALAPTRDHSYRRPILTSPAEYATLLDVARGVDPDWAAMVEVAACTGPRFSEITALAPAAVDVARNRISYVEHWAAGAILPGTKNRTVRTVPVPADVMTRVIVPRLGRALVFCRPGGREWTPEVERARWTRVRATLGGRGIAQHLTSHSMRKGYATWLKSHGIDPDKVALALGHVPTGVTGRHYTDLTDVDHDHIRAAVAPLVGATQ